jgi:hypothetical protein
MRRASHVASMGRRRRRRRRRRHTGFGGESQKESDH